MNWWNACVHRTPHKSNKCFSESLEQFSVPGNPLQCIAYKAHNQWHIYRWDILWNQSCLLYMLHHSWQNWVSFFVFRYKWEIHYHSLSLTQAVIRKMQGSFVRAVYSIFYYGVDKWCCATQSSIHLPSMLTHWILPTKALFELLSRTK